MRARTTGWGHFKQSSATSTSTWFRSLLSHCLCS